MSNLTPVQQKLLQRLLSTGQTINLDARGNPFLMDGTQINRRTLESLARKQVLAPCGTDLFGGSVSAYEVRLERSE